MSDKSYTILAKGLWCRSESDWDQSSASDEYYAITTVLGFGSDGSKKQKTVKLPGANALSDVDDGDFRKFEVVLWKGPLESFQLGTQLLEEDQGDSDRLHKLIKNAAEEAIRQGGSLSGVQVSNELNQSVSELIADMFGFGDDLVDSYQTRYFGGKQLAALAATKQKVTKPEGCRYRFRTWHSGGGSAVVLYYDVFES